MSKQLPLWICLEALRLAESECAEKPAPAPEARATCSEPNVYVSLSNRQDDSWRDWGNLASAPRHFPAAEVVPLVPCGVPHLGLVFEEKSSSA